MVPAKAFVAAVAALIGADTAWLAEATAFVMVTLLKATFTPSAGLDIGSVTPAAFTGSTPLHATSAATQVFRDPNSGDWYMQVKPPAGGWHWQASAPTSPAETIYGYMLTNAAGDKLIASALLDTPVAIALTGDGVDIGDVFIRLPTGAMK